MNRAERLVPWMALALIVVAVCVPIGQAFNWPTLPVDAFGVVALVDMTAIIVVLLRRPRRH
jgi:hypothetical protein